MDIVLLARADRPTLSWKIDVRDALLRLGHTVHHVDDRSPVGQVWEAARGADLLLWVRTHRRDPEGDMAALLGRLHGRGVVTASWHMDLYWGLAKRERTIGQHPFWLTQYVFTADGHPRPWQQRGVNHRWAPACVGSRWLGYGTPRPELACDVAFFGVRKHHPEWPYRRQLVDWLARTYGPRFRWYAAQSPNGDVRGNRLRDAVASAKVVVGDSCCPGFTVTRYWSDRLPVVTGLGGLLIHPEIKGMAEQGFVDGDTVATYRYGDFRGLRAAIGRWLDDPAGRRKVTDRAIAMVSERHTFDVRITEILNQIGR